MKLTPADAPKMILLEDTIITALKAHNLSHPGTESMIGVVALVRIARRLLDDYDAKTQAEHVPALAAHLRGDGGGGESNILWTPPHFGKIGGNGGR